MYGALLIVSSLLVLSLIYFFVPIKKKIADLKNGLIKKYTVSSVRPEENERVNDVRKYTRDLQASENSGIREVDSQTYLRSITGGAGIAVTPGESPTVTNTGVLSLGGKTGTIYVDESGLKFDGQKLYNADRGSSQNIFKEIKVDGEVDIKADTNHTNLYFAAGTGMEIDTNNDEKRITFNSKAGWIDHGSVVSLIDEADNLRLNGVTYAFPNTQGGAGTFLQNDGSGALTWASFGASMIPADSLDFTELKDNLTLDANTDIALAGKNFSFSGTGNVGIGSTSPNYKLHVEGNSYINGSLTTKNGITVDSADSAYPFLGQSGYTGISQVVSYNTNPAGVGAFQAMNSGFNSFRMATYGSSYAGLHSLDNMPLALWAHLEASGGLNGMMIETRSNVPIAFYTDRTERMRVSGTGNLGIGTTSPLNKLHVVGNGTYTASFMSGNVGIGTTSPGSSLDVISSATGGIASFITTSSSSNPALISVNRSGNTTTYIGANGSAAQGQIPAYASYISSWNNNVAISIGRGNNNSGYYSDLLIGPTGNVGIGTTSPNRKLVLYDTAIQPLDILFSHPDGANPDITFYTGITPTGGSAFDFNGPAAYSGTGNHPYYLAAGNAVRLAITPSGNIGIGTTSPSEKLSIYQANSSPNYINFTNSTKASGTWYGIDIGGSAYIWNREVADIYLGTSATTRLNISSAGNFNFNSGQMYIQQATGNVGIGTTSPGSKLEVVGSSDVKQLIVKANSSQTANIQEWQDGNGITKAYITSNGRFIHDYSISNVGPDYQIGYRNDDFFFGFNAYYGDTQFKRNGSVMAQFNPSYFIAPVDLYIGLNADAKFSRDAANIIAQRYGTSAQEFRIYNSDSTADEFASLGFINNSNVFGIETEQVSSGTVRPIALLGGNVGIGTTSPGQVLTVNAVNSSDGIRVQGYVNNTIDLTGYGAITHAYNSTDNRYSLTSNAAQFGITGNTSGALALGYNTLGSTYHGIIAGTPSGSSAGGLNFYLGGSTSPNIIFSNNGNVGIGTTAPSTKLHVVGDARVTGAYYDSSNTAGSSGYVLTSTGTGTAWSTVSSALSSSAFLQGGNSFGALASLGTNDNYGLGIRTSGVERVRIDTNGNVGVGTTAPGAQLTITNPVAGLQLESTVWEDWTLTTGGASGNFYIDSSDQSGAHSLSLAKGSRLLITASSLNLASTGSTAYLQLKSADALSVGGPGATSETRLLNTYSGGIIGFNTSTGEKVRITDAGNVGIGTTAPGMKFQVVGNGTNSAAFTSGNVAIGKVTPTQSLDTTGDIRFSGSLIANNNLVLNTAVNTYFRKNSIIGDPSSYSELMFIDGTSGNVGIGSVAPTAKLHVVGSGTYAATFMSGNVGIGTTAPTAKLQIDTTVGGADALILRDTTNNASSRFYFSSPVGSSPDLNITADRLFLRAKVMTTAIDPIANGSLTLGSQSSAVQIGNAASFSVITNSANTTIFSGGVSANTVIRPYSSSQHILLAPDGGNVGIGTTSPAAVLELTNIGSDDSFRVNDQSADTSPFIIDSSGYVGINRVINALNGDRFTGWWNNATPTVARTVIEENSSSTTSAPPTLALINTNTTANNLSVLAFGSNNAGGNISGTASIVAIHGTRTGNFHNGSLAFYTAQSGVTTGAERMRLDYNGNLGIGTTSPAQKLHVVGSNVRFDSDLIFQKGSATNIFTNDANSLNLGANGQPAYMTINTSGNVGIGTTAPGYKLELSGGNGIKMSGGSRTIYVTGNNFDSYIDSDQSFRWLRSSDNAAYMVLNGTSGNLGIGTTAPAGKLDVTDTSNSAASLNLTNNTATTIGAGVNTLGVIDLQSSSLTTGNFMNVELNGLTSGKGINLTSTSTGLTTGNLMNMYWNPGSAATATGDLFKIDIGANALVSGNLFGLYNNGSALFTVGTSKITSALPHEFTAAGDVSFASDISLTDQTSNNISSLGPLTITSGENYENLDLTLKAYGTGGVFIDSASLSLNTGENLILDADDSSDSYFQHNNASNYLSVFTDGTEVARFMSDGSVDANTTFDANQFDIAEYYPTTDSAVEAGDVVVLSKSDKKIEELSAYLVNKVDSKTTDKVLGVVSTKPGFSMGGGSFRSQFCAKVTDGNNGEATAREELIRSHLHDVARDILLSQTKDEKNTGATPSATLKTIDEDILQNKVDELYEKYKKGENDILDEAQLSTIEDKIATCKSIKQVPIALAGRVPVKVDLTAGDIKTGDLLTASPYETGKAMKATGAGWVLGRALEDAKNGDKTVMVYVFISWYDPAQNGSVAGISTSKPLDLSASVLDGNLTATGKILANEMAVTDHFTVGLLQLNASENSINTVAAPLLLQNTEGAGEIQVFGGKLVMTVTGGIVSQDMITAKTVAAEQYAVLGASENASIGEGTIPAGKTEITINNSRMKASSKVFVTATSNMAGKELIVKEKKDGSFTVVIESANTADITFDYWIVGVMK